MTQLSTPEPAAAPIPTPRPGAGHWVKGIAVTGLFFVAGMALTRIGYEAAFPRLLWLGQPFPVILLSAVIAITGRILWGNWGLSWTSAVPLLLNLVYLFDPTVDLIQSRFLCGASLWFVALLAAREWAGLKRWRWLGVAFVVVALMPIYLFTMPHTVGRADTFEFQVVVPQLGIAHPTGYPLYLLLGKLGTLLNPFGSAAWRLNLVTAVFGIIAATLVYRIGLDLFKRPAAAVLGAVALGLTPTFWSQSIEAEVYTLHALFVALALWLMVRLLTLAAPESQALTRPLLLLAFVIGLGLTNHLTTVFLIPAALLTFLFTYLPAAKASNRPLRVHLNLLGGLLLAFLLPLLLYAYLPIRWSAVNHEPMGLGRFVEWVVAGRFQGSLQPMAWLRDPTRWQIVARLFVDNWGGFNLLLIGCGALLLFWRNGRVALIFLITWLGYSFYALNYYVPDLAVFLMAAHVIMGIWLGVTFAKLEDLAAWGARQWRPSDSGFDLTDATLSTAERTLMLGNLLLIALFVPTLLAVAATWQRVDRSAETGLIPWGSAVLDLPLAPDSAILADSEKIAPLTYLQQAEGVRPDLDIMVLPDEASYRAELDTRIAAGQTVYLARFLPGLQAIYHLNSAGPLIEVSQTGRDALPETATPTHLTFGEVELVGYETMVQAPEAPAATRVTLYWQADPASAEQQFVYVRWADGEQSSPADNPAGQHPAANYYPTTDWEAGEIVVDYHLLPQPVSSLPQTLALQVALGPAFAPAANLAWQTVTQVDLPPAQPTPSANSFRAQIGRILLSGATFPTQARPQAELAVQLRGTGVPAATNLFLRPAADGTEIVTADGISAEALASPPFQTEIVLATDVAAGSYLLVAAENGKVSMCGWLLPASAECILGSVEISGAALPDGAINYDDQIALLDIDIPDPTLRPNSQWPITLTWQSLAPISEDYTVFIQLLDANDQIVGQVDAWPLQGTYPTSQWQPGETVIDPHIVLLQDNLPPGPYRLQVGWYLLETLRRLPLLDESGNPLDDKLLVPGLSVPEP